MVRIIKVVNTTQGYPESPQWISCKAKGMSIAKLIERRTHAIPGSTDLMTAVVIAPTANGTA